MNFESKHNKIISEFFDCDFSAPSNSNLSPGQSVSTIVSSSLSSSLSNGLSTSLPKSSENDSNHSSHFQQLNSNWGIQPCWSKRLLINAQSETVLTKATFKEAIRTHRCLIPCSGWYEWRTEGSEKKKYLFSHVNEEPFLMAGIWYSNQSDSHNGHSVSSSKQVSSLSSQPSLYPNSHLSSQQSNIPEHNPELKQQLVTLTTEANVKCAEYHQRMPLIILPQYRDFWFQCPAEQLTPLFQAIGQGYIKVTAA